MNTHKRQPCGNCPFRKDSMEGWLGAGRMEEICNSDSFTCHKTNNAQQCAGHMLLLGMDNQYVQLATRLGIDLGLKGRELVFDTISEAIKHHANKRDGRPHKQAT